MKQRSAKANPKVVQQRQKQPDVKFGKLRSKLHHPHAHLWAIILTGSLVTFLIAVWTSGNLLARRISLGGNKIAASSQDNQFWNTVSTQVASYKLTLQQTGQKQEQYSFSEMGVSLNKAANQQEFRHVSNDWHNKLLWWKSPDFVLATTVDEQKFTDFINQHARHEITPSKNALLKVNSDGTIATEVEAAGREYGLPNARQDILDAVQHLRTTPLVLSEREAKPTITLQSLNGAKIQLQKILSQKISLKLESKTIEASAHDIGSWLVISPDEEKGTYKITIDSGKVKDYINTVAAANVTRPRNQVEVVRSDGTKSILVQGSDGIDVSNKDTAVKSIVQNTLKLANFSVDLELKHTPYKVVNALEGNKLVEVDVTAKRMYAYENNVLVRTFLISAGAAATPTVTGQFSIYSKVRSQTMTGFNADGSRYVQPNVEWVNYFYRDYAVHGNYWRPSSYFGSVNSSHGCVGIVNSDAEWFYNWAPIGTTVVVHT